MPGLIGATPERIFSTFRDHLASLLNGTITDARLGLVVYGKEATIAFGSADRPEAALLRSGRWFLALGQNLRAIRQGERSWRLRTIQYRYRIQGARSEDDPWYLRFEYVSREIRRSLYPRHHLHLPLELSCGNRCVDLGEAHIPTGWVTVEELIRFLIQGLGVRPRKGNWDKLLRDSEEKFSEWTQREV